MEFPNHGRGYKTTSFAAQAARPTRSPNQGSDDTSDAPSSSSSLQHNLHPKKRSSMSARPLPTRAGREALVSAAVAVAAATASSHALHPEGMKHKHKEKKEKREGKGSSSSNRSSRPFQGGDAVSCQVSSFERASQDDLQHEAVLQAQVDHGNPGSCRSAAACGEGSATDDAPVKKVQKRKKDKHGKDGSDVEESSIKHNLLAKKKKKSKKGEHASSIEREQPLKRAKKVKADKIEKEAKNSINSNEDGLDKKKKKPPKSATKKTKKEMTNDDKEKAANTTKVASGKKTTTKTSDDKLPKLAKSPKPKKNPSNSNTTNTKRGKDMDQHDDKDKDSIICRYIGVTFRSRRNKYQTRLYRGCREYNLGLFDLAADAALAYDVAHRVTGVSGSAPTNSVNGNGEDGAFDTNTGEDEAFGDVEVIKYALDWLESTEHDTPTARYVDHNPKDLNFLRPLEFRMARKEEMDELRQGKGLYATLNEGEIPSISDIPTEGELKTRIKNEIIRLAKTYATQNIAERLPSPMGESVESSDSMMYQEEDSALPSPRIEEELASSHSRKRSSSQRNSSHPVKKRKAWSPNQDQQDGMESMEDGQSPDFIISRFGNIDGNCPQHGAFHDDDHEARQEQAHALLALTQKKQAKETKKEALAQKLSAIMNGGASTSQPNQQQPLHHHGSEELSFSASNAQDDSLVAASLKAAHAAAAAGIKEDTPASGNSCAPPDSGNEGLLAAASAAGGLSLSEADRLKLQQANLEASDTMTGSENLLQNLQLQQHMLQQQHQAGYNFPHAFLGGGSNGQGSVFGSALGNSGMLPNEIANLANLLNNISPDQLRSLLAAEQLGMGNNNDNSTRQQLLQEREREALHFQQLQAAFMAAGGASSVESPQFLHATSLGNSNNDSNDQMKEHLFGTEKKPDATSLRTSSSANGPSVQDERIQQGSDSSYVQSMDSILNMGGIAGFNGPLPPEVVEQLKQATIERGEHGLQNGRNSEGCDEVQALLQKQLVNEAKKAALAQKLSALMGGASGVPVESDSQSQLGESQQVPQDQAVARAPEDTHGHSCSFGALADAAANEERLKSDKPHEECQTRRSNTSRSQVSADSTHSVHEQDSKPKARNTPIKQHQKEDSINVRATGKRATKEKPASKVSKKRTTKKGKNEVGELHEQRLSSGNNCNGQPEIERGNAVDARPHSSQGMSVAGNINGNRHETGIEGNQGYTRGPDEMTSNATVGVASASVSATSLPHELQEHQQRSLSNGLDEQSLRNLLLKSQLEEMNKEAVEKRLREMMGEQQSNPKSNGTGGHYHSNNLSGLFQSLPGAQGNAASTISRQLQQIDEDQERQMLQSLLQNVSANRQEQLDPVQQALLQSLLANQQRDFPEAGNQLSLLRGANFSPSNSSAMQNQASLNTGHTFSDALTFDVVNRRLAIESMLMSEESRLRQLREALQSQFISQPHLNPFGGMNQLNLAGFNVPASQRELILDRDRNNNVMNDELRNALLAEKLMQGNLGDRNNILNGLDGLDRNNQAMSLQQMLGLQQATQGGLGYSQSPAITQEMLMGLPNPGGGMNNFNEQNQGANSFSSLQASLLSGQDENLGALAQLLGMSQSDNGNAGPDRVESGNIFQRQGNNGHFS